jgi:hypothetical protein
MIGRGTLNGSSATGQNLFTWCVIRQAKLPFDHTPGISRLSNYEFIVPNHEGKGVSSLNSHRGVYGILR